MCTRSWVPLRSGSGSPYTASVHALLILWDLSGGSKIGLDGLRRYIREESIERFRQVEGLRQKAWISNPETMHWGAFYLFETRAQADAVVAHVGEGRVVQLTGLQPTVERFDVEAVVEGRHTGTDLFKAGLALERAAADEAGA